jgi:hypothetical protein
VNQFFVSADDPILNEPGCEGIAAWMRAPFCAKHAEQGAEIYDRVLLLCATDDTGAHRFARLAKTVWKVAHLSCLFMVAIKVTWDRHGRLPTPDEQRAWLVKVNSILDEVKPAVPLTSGVAAVGATVLGTRYAVEYNYHWPFERVLVPHDGGDPIWEPYEDMGEIPLPALSTRGKDKFDTSLRIAWQLRQQFVWIMQQRPDDEAVTRSCFASPADVRSNGIILKNPRQVQHHTLTIWDAVSPLLSKVEDPLRATPRYVRSKSFQDLFGGSALGEDYQHALKLTMRYDPEASPDVIAYLLRFVKKRRIDAYRSLVGKATDRRSVPYGDLIEQYDAGAGVGWEKARHENGAAPRLTPTLNTERFSSNDALGLAGRRSTAKGRRDMTALRPERTERVQSGDVAELNDLWVDRSVEGWADKSRTHTAEDARLASTGDGVLREIAQRVDLNNYYQSLSPTKQAAMRVVMGNRGEASTRLADAVLGQVLKATGQLVSERTARSYVDEVKQKVMELEGN